MFFFNDTPTPEIYTLSLHDALPISDIEAERKKRDEIEAGKSYCSRRFGGATCDDESAQIYARFDKNDWRIQTAEFYRFHDRSEERFSRNAETDPVCRLLPEKTKCISVDSVSGSSSPRVNK